MGNDGASATPVTFDAIRRVFDAFENSNWTEIDIRMGDVRIHLSAVDVDDLSRADSVTSAGAHQSEFSDAAHGQIGDARPIAPGTHVVTASSPGIFWCSPEPGAPPFVDVGDDVDASTTVCIIEVMKLMNHVKAGTAGRVVAVYGVNGAAVEMGSPLLAIERVGAQR